MERIENPVPKPRPRGSQSDAAAGQKEKPIIAPKSTSLVTKSSTDKPLPPPNKPDTNRQSENKPKVAERINHKPGDELINNTVIKPNHDCANVQQAMKDDVDSVNDNKQTLTKVAKGGSSVGPNVAKRQPVSRPRTTSDMTSDNIDSRGKYLLYDVREDEEQMVKMQEIIDLLLAGGYFRARIKGLHNFDKIVGGMSWAIEMSNVDLDVDILFQENLTIGQKIALTEKIVRVLQKMKCPHQLEPHQIQGMDCIHIFPVIQWLVKKSIETRQQMHDYIKMYSGWQFNKSHTLEMDVEEAQVKERTSQSISDIDIYRHPRRKYRHPARHKIPDEETRIKTTLLEYGRFASGRVSDESSTSTGTETASRRGSDAQTTESLINSMTSEPGKISSALVGTIVGAQSDEIQKLAEEYQRKKHELIENSVERKELLLRKKVETIKREISLAKENEPTLMQKIDEIKEQISQVKEKQKQFELNENESEEERQQKERYSLILETLKKQKSEFKTFCREEKVRLEKQIEDLTNQTDTEDEGEMEIEVQTYQEKHSALKLQLAALNKETAKSQRKLDDIPSRAELSQYQKRFIELYNQVAAKHNETKKFYTLYNTLDDERMYLEKELNLLNSILENFHQAQTSANNREQFLLQFEQIVDGIKQTKHKVETRRQTEKMKRDQLNEQYLDLIEKQRLYYKAVKDFKEECRKNESLVAKLADRSHQKKHNDDDE